MAVRGLASVTVYASDVAASRQFYADLLGLTVVSDEQWGVVIQAGAVQLFLHPRADRVQSGVELMLDVDDVDEAIARMRAGGAAIVEPPADREWGDRDACIADPDGNAIYLRTGHPRGRNEGVRGG